nr:chitin deacetylase 5b [Antheraea pernyi]
MRWSVFAFSLILVALAAADDETSELPLAEPCDEETCKLPECRCSSTSIPGGLQPRDTPQFVTLTFDDAVNVLNTETYRNLIYNRVNSNGCPAGTTFYVSHEYTNYQLVNELYNNGFEIALHSISHRTPQTYWAEASYEVMVQELADQRVQMAHFANIPYDAIKGVRIPFLQLSGNNSFLMMANHDILYDCSWPTTAFTNPGLWPYTLHHTSTQDCVIPPCPTASIPGPWVMPMVAWSDLLGIPCSMVDACFAFPDREDEDAWFSFILTNFERHYLRNRAPFGFYVHEWYLSAYPAVQRALARFLDLVNNLEDAYLVNSADVIDWIKDPVPINEYRQKPCKTFIPTTCPASSCGPIVAEHNGVSYWMQLCNTCPNQYPWVGNPLGL